VKAAPDQPGTAGAGLIPLQRRRTGPIDVTSEAITVPITRPTPALAPRPRPATILGMQNLLDAFTAVYNTGRTHRALPPGTTPQQAYQARPKAGPAHTATGHFRIRHDTVDQFGKLTLRHGSRLHHLGVGRTHAHAPVLILVTTNTVSVISKAGHQVLSSHHIDADKNYWRNQNKNPGRWPGNL
jgi:hypothetical protein